MKCILLSGVFTAPQQRLESRGIAPSFLTSALDRGGWSASRPYRFTPGVHCIGGWVGPSAGLNVTMKIKICCLTGNRTALLGRGADNVVTTSTDSSSRMCSVSRSEPSKGSGGRHWRL
jgi:hypothetical protein